LSLSSDWSKIFNYFCRLLINSRLRTYFNKMKNLFLIVLFTIVGTTLSLAQAEIGLGIGDKAPELVGKSPDGKIVKLSDTRGKLVLIDFWASWCPPCRRENPNIVDTYNKYKNKKFENGNGFTVFGISLDKTKEAWEKAIIDDKLSWSYHISDLQFWKSKHAAIYNIKRIPTSFLIDENGIILAKNPKGPSLEALLKKYLK